MKKLLRKIRYFLNRPVANALQRHSLALGRIETRQMLNSNPAGIQDAEFSVFSQHGEDGIIQWLINKIEIPNEIFIEFGVGDYRESNTRFLLMNNLWAGLIMDGGTEHLDFVNNEIGPSRRLRAIQTFITKENINGLIKDNGISGDIGLLSIDIDGMDYWVLQAIEGISPRILILEYNPVMGPELSATVPYKEDFFWDHKTAYFGASLRDLTGLANKKGYALLGVDKSATNAFYVRRDVLGELKERTVAQVWTERRSGGSLVNGCFEANNGDLSQRKDLVNLEEISF